MSLSKPISIENIASHLGASVISGSSGAGLYWVREPEEATSSDLTFVISAPFLDAAAVSKAGGFVVQQALLDQFKEKIGSVLGTRPLIAAKDAYWALARVSALIVEQEPELDWASSSFPEAGKAVHGSAQVSSTAVVCSGAVICAGAVVGKGTVVMPGAVVGAKAQVGEDCVIFPGAVLYPRTVLGNKVRLHSGVVLGADGFGYARGPSGAQKIWHLGRVIIKDDVEIGANTCIDRGTLKDSIVEQGAKIDNLVQVGHNGHIKHHAIICAQAGLAGNVTVGQGVILAGQAGIADKIDIGDGAIVGPQAGISKDVKPGDIMMSALMARPRREWWRLNALFDRLPELTERVKNLEKREKL